MGNIPQYYDYYAKRRIASTGQVQADILSLTYQETASWEIYFKSVVSGTVSAIDVSSAATWSAAVGADFKKDLINGALTAGYSGAITSIRIDGLTSATPPASGIIQLTNGASETERIAYTSYTTNGTGDYTFTVSCTLTYVYLNNDVASVEDTAPCVRVLNASIDKTNAATGRVVVSIDCDTTTFRDALDESEFIGGWFELRGYNVSAKMVYYIRFPILLINTVDSATTGTLAPSSNYYTKAENDALLTAKADKVGTDDIKITDSAKGFIVKDRTTSTYYRIFVDSGVIGIESI
jgi:hypothetical protein